MFVAGELLWRCLNCMISSVVHSVIDVSLSSVNWCVHSLLSSVKLSEAPAVPMALVFVLLTLDFSAVMIACNNNRFQLISRCSAACVQMLVAVTIINSGCYVR